jgi:acyl dehydratase
MNTRWLSRAVLYLFREVFTMWDTSLKGHALTSFSQRVDAARLQAFTQALGQATGMSVLTQSELDLCAVDGRALPVPPTFFFCMEMGGPRPMEIYERLGVDYAQVLHGEQHFEYHRVAWSGETLHFQPRITDLYEKKAGSLRFVVWETQVLGADGDPVAELRSVMVVRAKNGDISAGRATRTRVDLGLPGWQTVLVAGPVSPRVLAAYADASGDHNPLHLDADFARIAGMPDAFAHGMLSASWLAQALGRWVDPAAIKRFSIRFVSVTAMGDEVHCLLRPGALCVHQSEPCVVFDLLTCNQDQALRVVGSALVAQRHVPLCILPGEQA